MRMHGAKRFSEGLRITLTERNLCILVHSLFGAWMLSFLFEGQILYALMRTYQVSLKAMVFGGIAAHFVGLCCGWLFLRTKSDAKRLYLISYPIFIATSAIFFFPPSHLWTVAIIISSLLAGICVAAWGFYLKSSTPRRERVKAIADMLILSNVLMLTLNSVAIHLTPHHGLTLAMLLLVIAIVLAYRLPENDTDASAMDSETQENSTGTLRLLAFMYLFIAIITINSGLMYGVTASAFAHLEWLTSWYWAVPYIVAIAIMRNLPRTANRTYILYTAIAMMGLSFIAFAIVKPSALGYLLVNTLMLGAFGIFDLFWWSIFGEMLDLHSNPAKILGVGLSANVLGVLAGGFVGSILFSAELQSLQTTLLALAVVCVTSALLPPLHKHLSVLLQDHIFLTTYSAEAINSHAAPDQPATDQHQPAPAFIGLSNRESEVAARLLQGKTYRMIASELCVSENTVKYFVKNIYAKYGVQSRGQFVATVLAQETDGRSS